MQQESVSKSGNAHYTIFPLVFYHLESSRNVFLELSIIDANEKL